MKKKFAILGIIFAALIAAAASPASAIVSGVDVAELPDSGSIYTTLPGNVHATHVLA